MTNQHSDLFAWRAPVALFLSIFFLVLPPLAARAEINIQHVISPKGVTAWLVEDHTVPTIAIHFVFDGGTAQDPDGKEGLANLMTGLFHEGAGELDSDAFQVKLDDASVAMSFEAQHDGTHGSIRMLSEKKDAAFDLLTLAVGRPRFDKTPVDRVRAQVLSGIIANERNPEVIADGKWLRAIYGEHPYSRPHEGTRQSVAAITTQDLSAFHKANFAREGLYVGVVGDIDAATLRQKLDQVFGDLPEKQALAPVADIEPKLGQQLEVDYNLSQTKLHFTYPGVNPSAPDYFAGMLMNDILGGQALTSRLFDEVREKRGLAYGVGSFLVDDRHSNALVISTSTRSDRASETLSIIRDVVEKMAQEGPTQAELEAAKKHLTGAFAIDYLASSSAIAETLLGLQFEGRGTDYMQRRASLIDAVTLNDVKAVAKKLLSASPAVMIVGPTLPPNGKDGNG
ncbi:pitrilysin family protein [Mesorhizobium sp. WSM3224]|uniref:M16 family metallopeptidase n=1 Tax=Mesorhizobium sp. WSM3224 TaxID=1040986 RepID=UPI0004069674|nr:pitrilysin family protein [Mesorhizobium sp. WSM3224]